MNFKTFCFTFLFFIGSFTAHAKISALIIDGQNNHVVWPKSTLMMKQYLEETGLFEVDIQRTRFTWRANQEKAFYDAAGIPKTKDLKKPKPDPTFRPKFSDYDVVISNFGFKAADWPKETQQDFEKYLSEGGGFVVVHAASNCFPKWKNYNEIVGLSGWGGRDQSFGSYHYYNDAGELVVENVPGPTGSHGKRLEFQVTIRQEDHPITKGMPPVWMTGIDECYSHLRGSGKNLQILATGYDRTGKAKPIRHEPVLMTIQFGKGRVFHTALGDQSKSFENVGFIVSFLRGTEWAATGQVTQEIPSDFPTADQSRSRAFELKD